MRRVLPTSFLLSLLAVSGLAAAQDGAIVPQEGAAIKRVALVIGNSHYSVGALKNPETDAREMSGTLKSIGFDTTLVTDADRKTLRSSIREFTAKLHSRNAFGFFYYSGHGAQYHGKNYLVPIGFDIESPEDLDSEAYDVSNLLGALREAGNAVNVVVLDACRDSPFATDRGFGSKGLVSVEAPVGTFIAYATAPGQTATDSGEYRECLIDCLKVPGLQIEQAFRRARKEMFDRTNGAQVPWDSSSLLTDYYLVPGSAPTQPGEDHPNAATLSSWVEKGDTYRFGTNGVKVDFSEAIRWYEKAANGGSASGQYKLAVMYDFGHGVAKNDEKAVELYKQAAEGGEAAAMYNYAYHLEHGLGIDKDEDRAATWYQKAVDGGDIWALVNLGKMYTEGRGGLPKDPAKAVELYKKAADAGDTTGMYNLGYNYAHGLGVEKDEVKALAWYRKAAEGGEAGAMVNLGVMYEEGAAGLTKDYEKAVDWYRKAADAGDPQGIADLADMYENGKGVEKNMSRALELYRKAAAQGNEYAKNALKRLGEGSR